MAVEVRIAAAAGDSVTCHELKAVLRRFGPGSCSCPISSNCLLASHKHYHCTCGAGPWANLTRAQAHAARASSPSVRGQNFLESVAGVLRQRCALKAAVAPALASAPTASPSELSLRIRRELHLRSAAPPGRLLCGTVFHNVPAVCERLQLGMQSGNEAPPSWRHVVTVGWQIRFQTPGCVTT